MLAIKTTAGAGPQRPNATQLLTSSQQMCYAPEVKEEVMLRYSVRLAREKGRTVVTFPDFPGVHTFGYNESEALAHALDALETMLRGMIEDREDIPAPAARRG